MSAPRRVLCLCGTLRRVSSSRVALEAALKEDIARRSPEASERQAAEDHVALLTPVIKGVFTDMGLPLSDGVSGMVTRIAWTRRPESPGRLVREWPRLA